MMLIFFIIIIIKLIIFTIAMLTYFIIPYHMEHKNKYALYSEEIKTGMIKAADGIYLNYLFRLLTCSELKIVNSHAKTLVLSLTVRIPKAHVSPSRGSSTVDAVNMDLCT